MSKGIGFGTLRYVEDLGSCSEYRDRDGNAVYLLPGTVRRVPIHELDLPQLYADLGLYRNAFISVIRTMTIDPREWESVQFCGWCDNPGIDGDMYTTADCHGYQICESCSDDWHTCDMCELMARYTFDVLDGDDVCESCRDGWYYYCEDCDGYYHRDCESDHDHVRGMCCESPARQFAIRNDGDAPLSNDTRATVTLPAGMISDEGIWAIRNYLAQMSWSAETSQDGDRLRELSYKIPELGNMWQTKEGNFTKRLGKMAYRTFEMKLSPEIVSRVGCIARDHSTAVNVHIEVTRELNMPASEFAHNDSCWWQSYYASRCTLKTNGGFGLRTFSDENGGYVVGRAWVMPLRLTPDGQLVATFETLTPDAFVVFNGYGDLEGYAPARVMAHMAGMTYRKISFSGGEMYVNNGSGYLVASEDIACDYTDGALALYLSQHSSLYDTERGVA